MVNSQRLRLASRPIKFPILLLSKTVICASTCHRFFHSSTTMSPSIRVLRDIKARHGVNANEIARRAYLYVARNQSLPASVRYQAQLQLNTFGRYTRPTTVKNRCSESGKGRGIMSEFALSRVCVLGLCFLLLVSLTYRFSVPIPLEGPRRRNPWCQEGILVEISSYW